MNVQRAPTAVNNFVQILMVPSIVHVEVATYCQMMEGVVMVRSLFHTAFLICTFSAALCSQSYDNISRDVRASMPSIFKKYGEM